MTQQEIDLLLQSLSRISIGALGTMFFFGSLVTLLFVDYIKDKVNARKNYPSR